MKIVAVIPCYNEGKLISEIVDMSKKYCDSVVVSDDKSQDHTVYEANTHGAIVVMNMEGHKGAGGATKRGIEACIKDDIDVVVTLDGDGQHNPSEMPFLLEPIRHGTADIVIGSRFLYPPNGNMPKYRKLGIKTVTWLVNVFSPIKFTDSLCCFRAFTKGVAQALPIEDNSFGFGTEMLIKARKKGLRVKEVPITSIYNDDFWQNHTMWPLWHGLSLVWATIKWRIKCGS